MLIRPLALTIPLSAVFWLIVGGIAYTAGPLFFANERLRYGHFIWHLFVLAGRCEKRRVQLDKLACAAD